MSSDSQSPSDLPSELGIAEHAVAAAYRALLLRDPDPAGLKAWCEALIDGTLDLEGLLVSLLTSDEFAGRSADFLKKYLGGRTVSFTNDVSQYGEIPLLLRCIVNETARHGIVVDVGARGRERSNSYDMLLHFGWRGLLIEANPNLIDGINRDFAGLAATVENCAVSDFSGKAPFYFGVNDDISSLDRSKTVSWGRVRGSVEVRVERLETILRAHDIPFDFDLLSIDAEGHDIAILNDLAQTDYVPGWIFIEASEDYRVESLDQLAIVPAVADRYELAGRTQSNLLLRSKAAARRPGTAAG